MGAKESSTNGGSSLKVSDIGVTSLLGSSVVLDIALVLQELRDRGGEREHRDKASYTTHTQAGDASDTHGTIEEGKVDQSKWPEIPRCSPNGRSKGQPYRPKPSPPPQ